MPGIMSEVLMAMLVKLWRNRYVAPIMREYGDTKYNPVLTTLTYPTRGRRNYYIPGDLVLTDVNKLADLQQSYPELERAAKQDPSTLESMLEIGLVFLGLEQAKYKTGGRVGGLRREL
jgi:hypothetical protein